jgi:long-chain acyl-CoA synthetase
MTQHPWERSYPPGVSWDMAIVPRPIPDLLDEAAADAGHQIFIDFLGRHITFGAMRKLADRVAKGLQGLGVGEGSRVALFLPNVPQYVAALFGALKTGATVVNLSPLLAPRELAHQVADSGAEVLVTLDVKALYARVPALLAETGLKTAVVARLQDALPFPKNLLFGLFKGGEVTAIPDDGRHMRFADLTANDGRYDPPAIDPERAVALLQYTGGTTGRPKGAMLTHAAIMASEAMYAAWREQFRDHPSQIDTVLLVLPLFHIFGLSAVLLGAVQRRAEIILHPRPDIDLILKDIAKKKPTILPGVPTLWTAIASHPKVGETDFSSLRYCASGGAPLSPELRERFKAATGHDLFEGYGLTETAPAATAQIKKPPYHTGSCGVPLPRTEIEIRSLEDGETALPPGEIGEVCIRGPQLMLGYWNRPEETAAALRGGWFRTGDTGYLDKEGFLYIVDRIKDLIITSGFNVYPRQIEEAIIEHPAVEEVTVIGVPDDYRGEAPKGFIKLSPGASLSYDELIAFLKDRLAKYALPTAIEIRDELPRTAVGKLSKKELIAEERAKHTAAREKTA